MGVISLDQFYYFWLIPSAISFMLSLLMALNIFLVAELRGRIYQRFLVLLALTDLIKTSSWFLGAKYTSPYDLCSLQEYLFQFGSLAQALVAALICFVAYSTVTYRQVPSTRRLAMHGSCLLALLIFSVSLNVAYKSSRLFCSHSYSGFYEKHFRTELYIYSLASLFPILGTVVFNLFTFFAISRRFRRMNVVLNLRESDAPLHVLVYRLRAYPIIYSCCYMPLLVIYVTTTFTGDFTLGVGALAAVCVSSLGSAVALNYFYYQKTLSPFVESVIYFWRPFFPNAGGDAVGRSDARSAYYSDSPYDAAMTEPMLASTNGDDYEDVTITRYFPSIDMTEPSLGTAATPPSKRKNEDEYLLTVD